MTLGGCAEEGFLIVKCSGTEWAGRFMVLIAKEPRGLVRRSGVDQVTVAWKRAGAAREAGSRALGRNR